MNRLNPNHLIWAVALMLTVGVPGSITAWNLTRGGGIVPPPVPAPIADTFAAQLAAAVKPLPAEARVYLQEQFTALAAVCQLAVPPEDDGAWQLVVVDARRAVYGDPEPFLRELAGVNILLKGECELRGLTSHDGKPIPWDSAKWGQLAAECLEVVR